MLRQNRWAPAVVSDQLRADGYAGSYSRVTDFTRAWRGREGNAPQAFVPLSVEQGEAFQFDWSGEGLVAGGIYRRMRVSHLKLCASRSFWLVAYPSQCHEMLFDAHTRSFAALIGHLATRVARWCEHFGLRLSKPLPLAQRVAGKPRALWDLVQRQLVARADPILTQGADRNLPQDGALRC